jgi:outer membrane protein assembly factor BamD (BamD/ComL family)
MPSRALAEERAILDDARRALDNRDPSAALERLREHATRFEPGELAEEREVLWIRALESQAVAAATIERIERFLRAFPRSPHRASLEQRLERWRETETGPRPEWQ